MLYNETGEYFILISKTLFGLDKPGFHPIFTNNQKKANYLLYQAVLFTHTFIIKTYIYRTENRLGSIQ